MSAPLDKGQKRYLSQLSDRAWARQRAAGILPAEFLPSETLSASAARTKFRHAQVAKACHKHGLRCCSQDDYGAIKAHFLHLLGEDGQAMKAHVHGASNDQRVAEWKLFNEIKAAAGAGITVGYVEAICRRQFGCTITDTTAKQKWALLYTVRNRAAAKKRAEEKRGKGEKEQPPGASSPSAPFPLCSSAVPAPAPLLLFPSAPQALNPTAA